MSGEITRVLVTGANGFVGAVMCERLVEQGIEARAAVRTGGAARNHSLLEKCVTHPAAAGQVFLVADGDDLSTPELLRRVARALGRKAWLLPFSPALLRLAARVAGRPGIYERLCGSLQVDAGKARKLLGWAHRCLPWMRNWRARQAGSWL